MSAEPEIGGHKYRFDPLDVFDQLDVARRLAPIVALLTMQKDREKLKSGFARAFVSMSSGMSREDVRAVLALCLAKVHRNQAGNYAPVCPSGQIMFEDIDLPRSLELLWEVLARNKIIDFFDEPLSTSKGKREGGGKSG